MKKKSIWLILLFTIGPLGINQAQGQAIMRETVGAYGTGGTAGNIVIGQTIGQPYFTGTERVEGFRLNPGFQQSFFAGNNRIDRESISPLKNQKLDNITVYPNPAREKINIIRMVEIEKARLKITKMNGKEMIDKLIHDFSSYQLHCIDWPAGYYLITISDENSNEKFSTKILITK